MNCEETADKGVGNGELVKGEKADFCTSKVQKYEGVPGSTKEVRSIASIFIDKQSEKCSVIAQCQKLYSQ